MPTIIVYVEINDLFDFFCLCFSPGVLKIHYSLLTFTPLLLMMDMWQLKVQS